MPGLRPPTSAEQGSLRLRLLVGTLVWVLLTVLVAGWALGRMFSEHVERQFQAELTTHLNQLAAQLTVDAEGWPGLRAALSDPRFARPYSGLYWQVDVLGAGAVEGRPERHRQGTLRSRSLWDVVLAVPGDLPADGEVHAHDTEGPDGAPLRMIEQVLRPAERPELALRVIVAANGALVVKPVTRFNRILTLALALLATGLAVAALVQVRVGLRPLARLRDGLAAVREGRSGAIDGRFPAEIQPLVEEFNAVLARNAEVVARARTHAGNLAHAVKTPLTVLANAAQAAPDDALAHLVRDQVALARTQVDYHLARSRAAAAVDVPGLRTPLRPVLEGLLRLMDKVHAGRGLALRLSACPEELAFRGEAQDLQEMLGNLVDNACKWATGRVEVCAERLEPGATQAQRALHTDAGEGPHGDAGPGAPSPVRLRVLVDDDGPGLAADAREAVFGRGVRADERTPGSGLGLSIVRELARLYGGDVRLEVSPLGGLRAVLELPLAR